MTQEEKLVQEISAAKQRSLNTGEPFPNRSAIANSVAGCYVFQSQWFTAQLAYQEAKAEVLQHLALAREQQVAPLVPALTQGWSDCATEDPGLTAPQARKRIAKYNKAITEVGDLLGIGDRNELIDWLDSHYPNWRGYPAPKVTYPASMEGAA